MASAYFAPVRRADARRNDAGDVIVATDRLAEVSRSLTRPG